MKWVLVVVSLSSWALSWAQGREELPLRILKMGDRVEFSPGRGQTKNTMTFLLALGNPRLEDNRAMARQSVFTGPLGIFAMNAAQYFSNGDGTWRVFNFRAPKDRDEMELERFLAFIRGPEGWKAVEEGYARSDYGKPGDFIYRKMRVEQGELPAPLNRLSREALALVQGIFQYNADGTTKILLWEPKDEDGQAQRVYGRMRREAGQTVSHCPNLQGAWTYRESSGQVDIVKIEQDFCEAVLIEDDRSRWLTRMTGKAVVVDGVELDLGEMGSEGGRLAGCQKFRKGSWEGRTLKVENRLECPQGGRGSVLLTLKDSDTLTISLDMGGGPSSSDYCRAGSACERSRRSR